MMAGSLFPFPPPPPPPPPPPDHPEDERIDSGAIEDLLASGKSS
jgi:hypothetical protein